MKLELQCRASTGGRSMTIFRAGADHADHRVRFALDRHLPVGPAVRSKADEECRRGVQVGDGDADVVGNARMGWRRIARLLQVAGKLGALVFR
ncbi:hypothetical protein [Streptomyces sp. KL116D]|uniref:hypothetical protein n=1 Tax=Streptomyces sp. KL116D TaxID=3045152 RepID=UPI003555CECA